MIIYKNNVCFIYISFLVTLYILYSDSCILFRSNIFFEFFRPHSLYLSIWRDNKCFYFPSELIVQCYLSGNCLSSFFRKILIYFSICRSYLSLLFRIYFSHCVPPSSRRDSRINVVSLPDFLLITLFLNIRYSFQ